MTDLDQARTPLAAHIAEKVAGIVEQAGRLHSLLDGRTGTSAEISRLDRELLSANADVLADAELSPLKARAADLTEVGGYLYAALPRLQEGDRLREEEARTAQSVLTFKMWINRLLCSERVWRTLPDALEPTRPRTCQPRRCWAKQMQRQVIIAVHERSLFDYLTLELSPAFEGDRLNVIELGRNAIGQTTSRWDPKLYVADRAIAA